MNSLGPFSPSLQRLAGLILEANRAMNLTADEDPGIFWQRHILDACAAARAIEAAGAAPGPSGRVLDVGAGAGIPGLAWAILWPGAGIDLIEPRRKRADFLRSAIAGLDLAAAVRVFEGRAEDLGRDPALRGQYALVTARALAPLPTLAELTLPFARVGGWVGAIKSAPIGEELARARRAIGALGGDPEARIEPYKRGDGKPCVVCLVRKLQPTPEKYPRHPNLPEKKPL